MKVRAAGKVEGIDAYMNLYNWFTGTTGLAIGERMRRIINPNTPKNESELAEAIDKWIEAERNLENIKDEYKLSKPFQFVALESIMNVGRAKDFYETNITKIR